MKTSGFRTFCMNKWFEHRDEIYSWTRKMVEYDSDYYFQKHRWLLKRMYQNLLIEEFAKENAKEIQKSIKRSMKKGNL